MSISVKFQGEPEIYKPILFFFWTLNCPQICPRIDPSWCAHPYMYPNGKNYQIYHVEGRGFTKSMNQKDFDRNLLYNTSKSAMLSHINPGTM